MKWAKKVRNPLIKRIPRELSGDWRKYLVVGLFLILTIGFVSGMYVANESMMAAAERGVSRYKLEDGHFELKYRADEKLLTAVSSGEKADVRQYYLEEAKEELDEKFETEFHKEFDQEFAKEFDLKFGDEFEHIFETQIRESLLLQGLDEAAAEAMTPDVVMQARQSGDYQTAYDAAYEEDNIDSADSDVCGKSCCDHEDDAVYTAAVSEA